MRIGLNALFFIPGGLAGVGVYATNLIRHLVQVAPHHNYILFVSKESQGLFTDLSNCLQVVVLPTPAHFRPLRILAEQCLLPFHVRADRLDLIHSFGFTAPLFVPCPSVVSILDLGFRHWSQRFSSSAVVVQNILIPAVARKSSHIITISQNSKSDIASELRIQRLKISVTYLACDPHRFQPLLSNRQELADGLAQRYSIQAPYFLSIASSHPHKNLEGLVQAYALLVKERGIKHQLVLVGHKRRAHARLLSLIDDLKLGERVILTGFVPDEEIPLLYALADVFVFPSFYEGFGIPPLEAMACGTPVVSSNATSLPEVVGDAAMLVDPYDVTAIAEGIFQILSDAHLRGNLIQCGFKRVREFSWERTALETLAVYERVASTE